MRKFRIYDNGGKTCDRYTFVIREKDSKVLHFWGASENPYHPQGLGQYCGASDDFRPCVPSARLGKKVKSLSGVPEPVAKMFMESAKDLGWGDNHLLTGVLA